MQPPCWRMRFLGSTTLSPAGTLRWRPVRRITSSWQGTSDSSRPCSLSVAMRKNISVCTHKCPCMHVYAHLNTCTRLRDKRVTCVSLFFFLGPSLIQQLLDDFLFRASRIIINSSNATSSPAPIHDFHPKYAFFCALFVPDELTQILYISCESYSFF